MRRFWGVLWGRGSPHCGVCAHAPPADSGSAVRRAAFQAWRCGQQAGRPRQPVRGQSGLQPPQLLAGSPARPHAGRCRDRPHLTGRRRRRASRTSRASPGLRIRNVNPGSCRRHRAPAKHPRSLGVRLRSAGQLPARWAGRAEWERSPGKVLCCSLHSSLQLSGAESQGRRPGRDAAPLG